MSFMAASPIGDEFASSEMSEASLLVFGDESVND